LRGLLAKPELSGDSYTAIFASATETVGVSLSSQSVLAPCGMYGPAAAKSATVGMMYWPRPAHCTIDDIRIQRWSHIVIACIVAAVVVGWWWRWWCGGINLIVGCGRSGLCRWRRLLRLKLAFETFDSIQKHLLSTRSHALSRRCGRLNRALLLLQHQCKVPHFIWLGRRGVRDHNFSFCIGPFIYVAPGGDRSE